MIKSLYLHSLKVDLNFAWLAPGEGNKNEASRKELGAEMTWTRWCHVLHARASQNLQRVILNQKLIVDYRLTLAEDGKIFFVLLWG